MIALKEAYIIHEGWRTGTESNMSKAENSCYTAKWSTEDRKKQRDTASCTAWRASEEAKTDGDDFIQNIYSTEPEHLHIFSLTEAVEFLLTGPPAKWSTKTVPVLLAGLATMGVWSVNAVIDLCRRLENSQHL